MGSWPPEGALRSIPLNSFDKISHGRKPMLTYRGYIGRGVSLAKPCCRKALVWLKSWLQSWPRRVQPPFRSRSWQIGRERRSRPDRAGTARPASRSRRQNRMHGVKIRQSSSRISTSAARSDAVQRKEDHAPGEIEQQLQAEGAHLRGCAGRSIRHTRQAATAISDIKRRPDRREHPVGWREGRMVQPRIPGGDGRRGEQAGHRADAQGQQQEEIAAAGVRRVWDHRRNPESSSCCA